MDVSAHSCAASVTARQREAKLATQQTTIMNRFAPAGTTLKCPSLVLFEVAIEVRINNTRPLSNALSKVRRGVGKAS